MRATAVLLGIVFFMAAAATEAQIYKWVDKDGVVHYGSTPPSEVDVEQVSQAREASDDAKEENADASAEEPVDGDDDEAEAEPEAAVDRGEMCATAIREVRRTIPGYLEDARKNLKGGHITREQYEDLNSTLAQVQAEITVSKCRQAQGRQLEFYECLARYAGDVMFVCRELAPDD